MRFSGRHLRRKQLSRSQNAAKLNNSRSYQALLVTSRNADLFIMAAKEDM